VFHFKYLSSISEYWQKAFSSMLIKMTFFMKFDSMLLIAIKVLTFMYVALTMFLYNNLNVGQKIIITEHCMPY